MLSPFFRRLVLRPAHLDALPRIAAHQRPPSCPRPCSPLQLLQERRRRAVHGAAQPRADRAGRVAQGGEDEPPLLVHLRQCVRVNENQTGKGVCVCVCVGA